MEDVDPRKLLFIASHFVPTWVERRGCVIREDTFSDGAFDRWWDDSGEDRRAVEHGMNHLHLCDLVEVDDSELGELWELGKLIASAWRNSLASAFPERRFRVEVTDDLVVTVTSEAPA